MLTVAAGPTVARSVYVVEMVVWDVATVADVGTAGVPTLPDEKSRIARGVELLALVDKTIPSSCPELDRTEPKS
jgi:hypothetical protein